MLYIAGTRKQQQLLQEQERSFPRFFYNIFLREGTRTRLGINTELTITQCSWYLAKTMFSNNSKKLLTQTERG